MVGKDRGDDEEDCKVSLMAGFLPQCFGVAKFRVTNVRSEVRPVECHPVDIKYLQIDLMHS